MAHIRLFNHYIHTPYLALGVAEGIAHFAIFTTIAQYFYGESPDHSLQASAYVVLMMCSTLAMAVYQSRFREGLSGMLLRSVVSYFLLGCGLLSFLYLFIPVLYPGSGVLAPAAVASLVVTILLRLVFYRVVGEERLRWRLLILGSGARAAQLVDVFQKELRGRGLTLVGVVPSGEPDPQVSPQYFLQGPSVFELARSERVDEIVVAVEERRRREDGSTALPIDDLLDCKLSGIRVVEASTLYEREVKRIEISLIQPAWLVYGDGFRVSWLRDAMKRGFDIAVSLVLLAVVWPFMLLTALAVWLEGYCRAPVLYRQVRVGLNGSHFEVLKFRSMRPDAEKDGKAVWAKKNDDRITIVGKFIRASRLDELPQIYNVLRGEMSFVGPRPERPEFVQDLARQIPFYDARHRVKPGLMGWAQLCYPYGASVEDAAEKLKYDLYYVKNHSLLLDILIVIQTVEVILLGKGVR